MEKIPRQSFYKEYYGHRVEHLEAVSSHLRSEGKAKILLAGDSSLDNKFWFPQSCVLKNGYQNIIQGRGKPDVAHYLNVECERRQIPLAALNCAVEESSVGSRACGRMLPQDAFIRETIAADDTLVVSVGGNDIALKPTIFTIMNMLALVWLSSTGIVESTAVGTAVPIDDCFCGAVCGCISSFLGWPLGLGYFIHLFKVRVADYVRRLVSRTKPKRVIICMIYYPCEEVGGWADSTLSALGYNTNPSHLQAIIRAIFRLATQKIEIGGTDVLALPLFDVLDPKNGEHYCQRVEPSPLGGSLMAKAIMDMIEEHEATYGEFAPSPGFSPVPQTTREV